MPNNKPGSRLIKAAGGVAWRPGPDGEPEILLVHRKKYDDWSLPKGKTEPDEPLPVTAVREVLEEGGASLALGRRLISVRYNVGGRPKRVHYWAARVLSVDKRAVPNSEVDEVTWLPAARAVDKVSYAHDHGVLADFAARPARTVPLILLRHSKAVSKSGWKRTDAARPLDDAGRSDAKALADLLACFAPSPRLVSSSAVRCAETLRPLAQLTGGQVRVEQSLYIHNQSHGTGAADSRSEITALVREVIASGEPTVICAHRENLPVLQEAALAVLAGQSGAAPAAGAPADASAELPKEWGETLPPSGFWVLNVGALPPVPDPAPGADAEAGPGAVGVGVGGSGADAGPGAVVVGRVGVGPGADAGVGLAAPSRRWWQLLRRARASRAAAPRPARGVASEDSAGADAAAVDAATRGTASADVAGADAAARRAAAGTASAGRPGDAGASAGESGPGSAAGAGTASRLGLLISADRYDLSEP